MTNVLPTGYSVTPVDRPQADSGHRYRAPATLRSRIIAAVLLAHAGLLILVVSAFNPDVKLVGSVFVLGNMGLGVVFVLALRFRAHWPFLLLLYGIFWLIYVAKAVVQHIVGFDSAYVLATIRVAVQHADYVRALGIVTMAHVIIGGFLVIADRGANPAVFRMASKRYLARPTTKMIGLALFAWIVVSAFVMRAYGVGVMGTAGVSLPYKLSAVLFYSRTIVVPLLLLYGVEKALARGDRKLLRSTIGLFTLLAVSEVLVRATKSPLFLMVLQVVVLYGLLAAGGVSVDARLRRRLTLTAASFFAAAVLAWPLLEAYRAAMVTGVSPGAPNAVAGALGGSGSEMFMFALERFFQRMLGFVQLAGVVAMPRTPEAAASILSYGDLASYYTHGYLGYSQIGHLSSPSLLGAAVLLGGSAMWPIVLTGYLAAMALIWSVTRMLHHLALPMRCFLATEFVNVVIAGTLDASLLRVLLALGVCTACELILRSMDVRRASPTWHR